MANHNYKSGIQWGAAPPQPPFNNANFVATYGTVGNDGIDPESPARSFADVAEWTVASTTAHSINHAAGVYNDTFEEVLDFGSPPAIRGFAEVSTDRLGEVLFRGLDAPAMFTNTELERAHLLRCDVDGYDRLTPTVTGECRFRECIIRNMTIEFNDLFEPEFAGSRFFRNSIFINCRIINLRNLNANEHIRECIFIGCEVETSAMISCYMDSTSSLKIVDQTDGGFKTIDRNNIECPITIAFEGEEEQFYPNLEDQQNGDDRFNQNSINTDPKFAVVGNFNNYTLQPDSPMIGTGDSNQNITGQSVALVFDSQSPEITSGTITDIVFDQDGFWLSDPGVEVGEVETTVIDLGANITLGTLKTIGSVDYGNHTQDTDNIVDNVFTPNVLNYLARWGDTPEDVEVAAYRSFIFGEPMVFDVNFITPGEEQFIFNTNAFQDIKARFVQIKINIRENYRDQITLTALDMDSMSGLTVRPTAEQTFPALDFSDPGATDSPFSMSFWQKQRAPSTNLVMRGTDNLDVIGFQMTDTIIGFPTFGTGDTANQLFLFRPVPPNEWTHYAITYDGSRTTAGMRLYINGVFASIANEQGTFIRLPDFSNLHLPDFQSSFWSSTQFHGLGFFDEVVTDPEIASIAADILTSVEDLPVFSKCVFLANFEGNAEDIVSETSFNVTDPPLLYSDTAP